MFDQDLRDAGLNAYLAKKTCWLTSGHTQLLSLMYLMLLFFLMNNVTHSGEKVGFPAQHQGSGSPLLVGSYLTPSKLASGGKAQTQLTILAHFQFYQKRRP